MGRKKERGAKLQTQGPVRHDRQRGTIRSLPSLLIVAFALVACRASRIDRMAVDVAGAPALRMQAILAPPRNSPSLEIRQLRRLIQSRGGLANDELAAVQLRIAHLHFGLGDFEDARTAVRDLLERVPPAPARARAIAGLIGGRALKALGRLEDARAAFAAARASSESNSLTAMIVDEEGRIGIVASRAPLKPGNFHVISRAEWGAKPPRLDRMNPMGRPTRVTIHHSALWCSDSDERAFDLVRIFQRTHMDERGWGDIGYHWLIDRRGRILAGRDLRYQGAHAGNHDRNRQNIGICLLGNFQPGLQERAQRPTDAQLASLELLVRTQAAEWSISASGIYTHQEIHPKGRSATACPGVWLAAFVAEMRQRLASEVAIGTR